MNVSVHQRIRILLEETNDAFSAYSTVNADFADFAVLALSEFKAALRDPNLTRDQLVKMLRRGMVKHQDKDPNSWAAFMAHHLAKAANRNGNVADFSIAWEKAHEKRIQDNS